MYAQKYQEGHVLRYIYIYIYIYVCVCVCIYIYVYKYPSYLLPFRKLPRPLETFQRTKKYPPPPEFRSAQAQSVSLLVGQGETKRTPIFRDHPSLAFRLELLHLGVQFSLILGRSANGSFLSHGRLGEVSV